MSAPDIPAEPTADPREKLRLLASRQVDEITQLRESLGDELSFEDHERIARTLIAMAKLIEQLFVSDRQAAPRKTGDELRQEDDAIRAEFERRLAAVLRGRDIARRSQSERKGN